MISWPITQIIGLVSPWPSMVLEESAQRLDQLESPLTPAGLRASADAWLTAFRGTPAAWAVALSCVAPTQPPRLRSYAARTLAWKCKHQLHELTDPGQRAAMAQTCVAALQGETPAPGGHLGTLNSLCVSLANLILQSPDVEMPLDALGTCLWYRTSYGQAVACAAAPCVPPLLICR